MYAYAYAYVYAWVITVLYIYIYSLKCYFRYTTYWIINSAEKIFWMYFWNLFWAIFILFYFFYITLCYQADVQYYVTSVNRSSYN